jgi:hypothetical protein
MKREIFNVRRRQVAFSKRKGFMDRSRSRRYSQHHAYIRIGAVVEFYSDWCNECDEKDEDWKISCLLKTAIELESSRIEDLSTATNLSRSWIAMVHALMERSGIWANGRVDLEEFLTCSWEGWQDFCYLHSLVATGKIVRSDERRNGQYVYRATESEKIYPKLSPEEKAQVQAEGNAHEDAAKLLKEKPASPKVQ